MHIPSVLELEFFQFKALSRARCAIIIYVVRDSDCINPQRYLDPTINPRRTMRDSTVRYKPTYAVRSLQPLTNLPATIFATIFVWSSEYKYTIFRKCLQAAKQLIRRETILTATPHKHILNAYTASTICNHDFQSFTLNKETIQTIISFANRLDITLSLDTARLQFSPPPRSMYANFNLYNYYFQLLFYFYTQQYSAAYTTLPCLFTGYFRYIGRW